MTRTAWYALLNIIATITGGWTRSATNTEQSRAALSVVAAFTGAWVFWFVFYIPYLVIFWQIHVVMSLFSAVWFVYIIKWQCTIRRRHVVLIGAACVTAYFIYAGIMIFSLLIL